MGSCCSYPVVVSPFLYLHLVGAAAREDMKNTAVGAVEIMESTINALPGTICLHNHLIREKSQERIRKRSYHVRQRVANS